MMSVIVGRMLLICKVGCSFGMNKVVVFVVKLCYFLRRLELGKFCWL